MSRRPDERFQPVYQERGTDTAKPGRARARSVSSLSIRTRLLISIGAVLVTVIAAMIWVGYREVSAATSDLARERLRNLTRQFASISQQTTAAGLNRSAIVANDPAVRAFIKSPSNQDKDAAAHVIEQQLALAQDPANVQVELWKPDSSLVLILPEDAVPVDRDLSADFARCSSEPFRTVGLLREFRGALIGSLTAAVRDESGKPIGFLVRWRRIFITPGPAQLRALLGDDTSLYFGNANREGWTDLTKVIPKPQAAHYADAIEYKRDGRPMMAMARPLEGTPWAIAIEISTQALAGKTRTFLRRTALISGLILFVGIVAAFLMARGMTRPLVSLTNAASAIADGDYSQKVAIHRSDELGKLANAFNVMVVKLGESQRALERDLSERTARLEAAPSAMLMVDERGRMTLVNAQLEQLFGYERAELLDQPVEMLVPERYHSVHSEHRVNFFHSPSARVMGAGRDLYGRRKDGTEVPIEIGLNPIRTDKGAFVLASIIDITERKRAEERFRLVVEASPSAMIMVNGEGRITLVNTQTENLFGYSRVELLDQPMEMLVPERFRGAHPGHRTGFFHNPSSRSMGAGRELFGRRKDSTEVPIEIGLNPINTDEGAFVLASIIDITERKRAEERFRLVVEAAPSAMIMVNDQGLISLVNTQTEQLFGYERTELLGKRMEILLPERYRGSHPDLRIGFFEHPSTRLMGAGRNLYGLRKDGGEVPIEIGLNPVNSDEGAFVLASIIDITERKKAQERFRLVVEAAPSAMLMAGKDGLITLVNQQAETLFGYARAELLGQPVEMLVPGRYRTAHPGHRGGFFASPSTRAMGAGRDLFGLRKDGSEMPIEIGLNPINTDEGAFVLASIIDITERKRSEERIRLVVEASPNAMLMANEQGHITLVNKQAENLFGYTRHELLNQPMEILVPQRYRAAHPGLRSSFFKSPSTRSMGAGRDLFGLCKDGSEVPIEIGLNPIRTDEGSFVLASIVDITERKQVEEKLRKSQEQLAGVIGSAMDAIITVDHQQQIVLFNSAAERMFLFPAEDAIGQRLDRFIPQRFRAAHHGHIESFGQTHVTERSMGTLGALYGLRADGEEFPIEASISQIEADGSKLYTVILRDITERKRADEALKEQARILDLAPVMIRDLNARIVFWNAGAEQMYGWKTEEAIDKISHSLLQTAFPRSLEEIKARLYADNHWEGELLHTRKDGQRIVVASHWVLHRDEHGKPKAVLEVNNDITERKQAEKEIHRLNEELEQRVADRTSQLQAVNKELEAFSYSVSHDLRAPLRHIDGFSQALLEDYTDKLDDAGKSYLREVRSASQEMAQLIDDLLQLARVTRSEMRREVVNLSDLVRTITAELKKRDPKRKVIVNLTEELATRGDKRLLKIVLNNLLGNAWKFTAKRAGAEITFGGEQKNGENTYFIRDNGAGFDMAYVGKLFGAFQRLHTAGEFAGTGIGLATVQRIVYRHGGRVWAEGAVDEGATFYFTLPNPKETGDEKQSDLIS